MRCEVRRRRGRLRWIPSEGQVLALAEVAPDERMRAFTLVAAFSGLRLFELAGLHREHVRADGRRLVVARGKGGWEGEESLLFEPGWSALQAVLPRAGRIFRSARGHAWSRQDVSKLFIPMREEVGLPDLCTFHSLRHFHATWLVDRGVPEIEVAAQMRHHDNGELVRRVYAHPSFEQALDRIDRRLRSIDGGHNERAEAGAGEGEGASE